MIDKDLSSASVWVSFLPVRHQNILICRYYKVIQSFIFHIQCSVGFGRGGQVFAAWSSVFSLEQTTFSTGQDGAVRSIGEELITTLGISYDQNSLSIRSSFLRLFTFEYYIFTESECHYKH